MTRTSPAIRSKTLKRMINSLDNNKINIFNVEIHEREAFKAIFDHNSILIQLTKSQVSGIDKARTNSAQFGAEVIQKLNLIKNNKF